MAEQALKLSSADRAFFTLVSQAAFANPFSDERVEVDQRIMEAATGRRGAADYRVEDMTGEVHTRLQQLLGAEKRVTAYTGEDRHLAQTALLFDIFHRYMVDFDRLVEQQLKAGDEPVPCPFAGEAVQRMVHRGLSRTQSCGYLGVFYQLRRAYYLIGATLVGSSAPMKRLRMRLWQNVFSRDIFQYERFLWNRMEDFSLLLLGETGTGKGTAAAAIGRSGYIPYDDTRKRFSRSFDDLCLSINLSQHPEGLIESELFGHRKGAFTGAIADYPGILARCSMHGAIFLDEIGEVGIPVQIKLLQVLQERVYTPVGSHDPQRFHGRVLAATNRPLEELRAGDFREDFYYRLCSDVVTVPTLRERLADDPAELDQLLTYILRRLAGEQAVTMLDELKATLSTHLPVDYAWPGNVRELEQAVRRILLTGIYRESQPTTPGRRPEDALCAGLKAGQLDAKELLAGYCALLYRQHQNYEEVARLTGLDRRTVKKYVLLEA